MIIAIETTRRPEASFSPISHHSPTLLQDGFASKCFCATRNKGGNKVNKFGGKEKTERERGGLFTSNKETLGISVSLYKEKKDN